MGYMIWNEVGEIREIFFFIRGSLGLIIKVIFWFFICILWYVFIRIRDGKWFFFLCIFLN